MCVTFVRSFVCPMANRSLMDQRWRQRQQLLVAAAFLQDELRSNSGRLMPCASNTYNLMAATAASSSSLPRALALVAAFPTEEGRRTGVRARKRRAATRTAAAAAHLKRSMRRRNGSQRFRTPMRKQSSKTHEPPEEEQEEEEEEEEAEQEECYNDQLAPLEPLCDIEDGQFKEHFGMDKHLLERLFREIHGRVQSLEDERPGHAFFKPSPKKVLLTAWLLCTRESFRGVAERFKVSKGGVHVIFINTCRLLVACSEHCDVRGFVHWPDDATQKANAALIESRTSLPGVIGCLAEMRIQEPVKIGTKVSPTVVILQGVCDARQRFIDVYVTDPGMYQPQTRVFALSPLLTKLTSGSSTCPGHHLIADTSYPLMTSLLTPYSDLTVAAAAVVGREHLAFNGAHRAAMRVADRTFARLLARFRRLESLHMSRGDLVAGVVQAICCLHNYIVVHEDVDNDDDELQGGLFAPVHARPERDDASQMFDEFTPDVDAIFKRDRISQMLDAKAAENAFNVGCNTAEEKL